MGKWVSPNGSEHGKVEKVEEHEETSPLHNLLCHISSQWHDWSIINVSGHGQFHAYVIIDIDARELYDWHQQSTWFYICRNRRYTDGALDWYPIARRYALPVVLHEAKEKADQTLGLSNVRCTGLLIPSNPPHFCRLNSLVDHQDQSRRNLGR